MDPATGINGSAAHPVCYTKLVAWKHTWGRINIIWGSSYRHTNTLKYTEPIQWKYVKIHNKTVSDSVYFYNFNFQY